jgi:hypothetical protein
MIENTQDLLTRLTTIDAAAERRFPISKESVRLRTDAMRSGVSHGFSLDQLRNEAISCSDYVFMGSGAGMKWMDATWTRLVEAFPLPADSTEVAAHITNDLMEANL